MRFRVLLPVLCSVALLSACTQTVRITEVADLPVKDTTLYSMSDWEVSPLRANYQYVFHGAHSNKARRARLGDYYFLSWYDAEPEKPVKIVMQYTQPRRSSGYRKVNFQFVKAKTEGAAVELAQDTAMPLGVTPTKVRYSVPESLMHGTVRVPVNAHAADGDILSWRMDVYCGDETTPRDTRKSFLWD